MYEIIDTRTYDIVYKTSSYAIALLVVSRNPWLAFNEIATN